MAEIKVKLTDEQQTTVHAIVASLELSGLLTDYHGEYPKAVVIHLTWQSELDSEPTVILGRVSLEL